MNVQNFLLVFILMLTTGTLTVTGFFFITRGQILLLVNGKEKKVGKVFKNWYFFWTKTKPEYRKIYYDNKHTYDLYNEIKNKFLNKANQQYLSFNEKESRIYLQSPELFREQIRMIEKAYDLTFLINDYSQPNDNTSDVRMVIVYKTEDDYVYPWWVRDPLATCATCFSSIYGSLYYWLLIALIREDLFGWTTYPLLAKVFFWVAFCLTLAVTNTALAKRFN